MASRQLKSLRNALLNRDTAKSEQILFEINHTTFVVNFDQNLLNNKLFKPGLFVSMMNTILPMLNNESLKIRMQLESFLTHWSSLISGFSPISLLKAYEHFDAVSTLPPSSQAIIFNLFTNTISAIPPSEVVSYIGTCHCMLMASKPEMLTKLAQNVWSLLRSQLTVNNVGSIVKFLVNSSIPNIVSFLCMKDPDTLFPIVAETSNLQFLKDFIPHWPDEVPLNIQLIENKIIEAATSSSSNNISAAIEAVELIAQKMSAPPISSHFTSWKNIIQCLSDVWTSKHCTISHQAALIDLFTALTKFEIIPTKDMQRFLIFHQSNDKGSIIETFPTTIQVSLVKMAAIFVNKGQIPIGLIEFLKKQAILRDPLLFVAVLQFLQKCFNQFYITAPCHLLELLELVLLPLPRYFVEQLQIIKLLDTIDWTAFPISKLPMNLIDIVLGFLTEPHPSVVEKLALFIQKMNIELPYAKLDWFEDASYYLIIFNKLDPSFIIELLDAHMLPSASYSIATASLVNAFSEQNLKEQNGSDVQTDVENKFNINQVAPLLFSRVIPIIIEGVKTLGYEIDQQMKSLKSLGTDNWHEYSEKLPQLLEIVNGQFSESTFGQIIENSLKLVNFTLKAVKDKMNQDNVIGLINTAKIFGCCFTKATCDLLLTIQSEFEFTEEVQKAMLHYFDRSLPFSESDIIAYTAVQILKWDDLISKMMEYLEIAADSNGDILIILELLKSDLSQELSPHRSFLSLKNCPNYLNKCIKEIPFDEWIICQNDLEFISQLSSIEIDMLKLDDWHQQVVFMYPKSFIIVNSARKFSHVGDFRFNLNTNIMLLEQNDGVDCFDVIENESKQLKSPQKIPDIINPYKGLNLSNTDECSLYELFCFLWFSNRQVNSQQWKSIENYVMSMNNDLRLVCAFFCYTWRNHMDFDTEKWPKLIKIDQKSHFSLLTVTLYLSLIKDLRSNIQLAEIKSHDEPGNIETSTQNESNSTEILNENGSNLAENLNQGRSDSTENLNSNLSNSFETENSERVILTDDEIDLIERTSISIGIQNSSEMNLVEAFKTETGIRKMLIESIMRIDLNRFSKILPYLSLNAITDVLESMKDESLHVFLPDMFGVLVDLLQFNELPKSPFYDIDFQLPSGIDSFLYYDNEIQIDTSSIIDLSGYFRSNSIIIDSNSSDSISHSAAAIPYKRSSTIHVTNSPSVEYLNILERNTDSFGKLLLKYMKLDISVIKRHENNYKVQLDSRTTNLITNFIIETQQPSHSNGLHNASTSPTTISTASIGATIQCMISSFIFYLLNKVNFTREQYLRIVQVIPPGHPLYTYYFTSKITPDEQMYLNETINQFVLNLKPFLVTGNNNINVFTMDRFDRLLNYLQNKPPSYSRELLKILINAASKTPKKVKTSRSNGKRKKSEIFNDKLFNDSVKNTCENHEIIISTKNEISKLIKAMTPIFFEFLIQGFDALLPNQSKTYANLNQRLYDDRFPVVQESILSFNDIDTDSFKCVKQFAIKSSQSAHLVTTKLFELIHKKSKGEDEKETVHINFCHLFNALNDDLAVIELCDQISSLLVYSSDENPSRRYLFDTIYTLKIFIEKVPLDQLMMAFFSNDFLNAKVKITVFLCVKMIINAIKRSNDEKLKEKIDIIAAMIQNRVDDPKFYEILDGSNDIVSLSHLLMNNELTD